MSIMVVLYMVGNGLDQAACAIVGQHLGNNDKKKAWDYYNAFRVVSPMLICFVMLLQWVYRVEIVEMYTNIESTRKISLQAIWLFLFNIFPDLFKGMMKGIIKALGI